MNAYSKYKETQIETIPLIPAHWLFLRSRRIFKEVDIRSADGGEELLSVSNYTGVTLRKENVTMILAEDYSGFKLCHKDDLVINIMWAWAGALGVSNQKGIVSSAYGVYRFRSQRQFHPKYFDFLARTPNFIAEYRKRSKGIRESRLRMYSDDFFEIQFPIPPYVEQEAIANFLENKNEKIKAFLFSKKQLIEKYLEKINVLVQSGFTKEKSNSKFWASIPENWNLEKAKRIFSEFNSKNHPEEELLAATQDRGVILKSLCDEDFVSPSGDYNGLKLVAENDFVISLRSFQGGIEHSAYKGIISPAYTVIRLKPQYNNEFYIRYFKYLFKTRQLISLLNTAVSGIREGKNINWADFCDLPLPIPPIHDIMRMQDDFDRYEHLVRIFEKEKKLLDEYKQSIISEVVTGKIKVT